MDLSQLGVFCYLDTLTGAQAAPLAQKVERLGYRALWFPETFGRDPFPIASHLLTVTDRLIVGTGIANVWKREPVTMMGAARTVAELFPDRFILGLGVSEGPFMARNGLPYEKPYSYMREYLARMKAAKYAAPRPHQDPPVVLGALLPKMLSLAAAETRGVMTAFVPPTGISHIRSILGPEGWICASQMLMLEADARTARRAIRAYLQFYLQAPSYRKNWLSLGFTDADFAEGGSDRLVDALVAWGDEDALRERIAAHYAAGATHVAISALRTSGDLQPDEHALELLAPR